MTPYERLRSETSRARSPSDFERNEKSYRGELRRNPHLDTLRYSAIGSFHMSLVMIDVESNGPIPGDYSMISFAAMVVNPRMDLSFKRFSGRFPGNSWPRPWLFPATPGRKPWPSTIRPSSSFTLFSLVVSRQCFPAFGWR